MTSKLPKTGMDTRGTNRLIVWCSVFLALVATKPTTQAAPLEEARVSRVIQDVRLLATNASPRAAAVNDDVKQGTAVRTGSASRAELTFTDQTITRLGQNTVFSVKGGTREVSLDSGAMLLSVPHGGEPAQMRTAAVTASISGGTGLLNSNKGYPSKLLVMEGTGKLCSQKNEDCETAQGGEMVMMLPDGSITKPAKFNAKLVLTTAHLLVDFPPLANEYLILQVINEQEGTDEEAPPNQDDTLDETDKRAAASPTPSPTSTSTPIVTPTPTPFMTPTPTPFMTPTPTPVMTPTPTPGGTPNKFGPPPTITSPDPYVIDSGTVINTDPSITNGVNTDYGTIYRGVKIDGPISEWAFGSTSSFDISSGFNDQFDGTGAAFKFSSLVVAGNPTVNTAGGETTLGLIGVNGIQIETVGTLTFAGLEGLLFATVNGSITLGNKTAFSGLHELNFYARGATSDLIGSSQMTTERHVRLYAERDILASSFITTEKFRAVSGRDISLNLTDPSAIDAVTIYMSAGRDLTLGGLVTARNVIDSEGDVSLLATHDIVSTIGIYVSRQNGGISSGLNLTIDAENDITIGETIADKAFTGLTLIVNNNDSELDNGGNITVNAGGNFLIQDGGTLYLNIANTDGGYIGDGGNINVTTGGSLTVPSIDALIDNSINGFIDLGGSIDFTIGGALTATGDAIFKIINEEAGSSGSEGGQEGGGTINVSASSIEVGGNLTALITNNGNPFASQGTVTVHADGNIMVLGNIDSWGSVSAGTDLTIGNITVAGAISVPNDLTANGFISATYGIYAFLVSAGTDITVGSVGGQGTNVAGGSVLYLVNDTTAGNALNLIDVSRIGPVTLFSFGDIGWTPSDMTITVDSIVTTGPSIPTLLVNGENATPDFGNNNPGNGGKVTLNINAGGLIIGSTGTINYVEANGGDYNDLSTLGGNGGSVYINATGDVTLNDGDGGRPAIKTLTGHIPGGGVVPNGPLATMGEGGTVDIQTPGTVTVNSTVIVSENEEVADAPSGVPLRRSASGGDITIASSKTSGSAINVTSSAQLLSLLSNAAPGPGGKITLIASNPDDNSENESTIDIDNGAESSGRIVANRGTVEIRHDGFEGVINISSADISADIVKIGALGTSGVLNISGGTISADTILKLYANGSNGTINFNTDVTLNSGSAMYLAANKITILTGFTVTINGDGGAANIFTNDPNYNFTPQPGYTGPPGNPLNGSFGGNGALDPQPLDSAPPFPDPPINRSAPVAQNHTGAPILKVAVPVRDQNGRISVNYIRSDRSAAPRP